MAAITLDEVNALEHDAFVERFGGVFEDGVWIATAAAGRRPFADRDELHAALSGVVQDAPQFKRLALIRAHPDLAGKAAVAGTLGAESTREQAAAGLDRLSLEEYERLNDLNRRYRERFEFPFVVCAREHTKESILELVAQRITHEPAEEEATALAEVEKIARLRLADLVRE